MTALKTASHNLLTQLQNAATNPEDVYVSVIPFNKDVNIGRQPTTDDGVHGCNTGILWEAGFQPAPARLSVCSNRNTDAEQLYLARQDLDAGRTHTTWNGCLTDRDQNFDTTNDAPLAGSTLYPAEQYSSCPTALIGLTNDWTTLSNKIDAMQPVGNTNQAIGLQMGWQSLTASPFTVPAQDPNYKYKQVIILLTDGLNTQDRWYNYASSIDARQEKTCANFKAARIRSKTSFIPCRSIPAATRPPRCCRTAPATPQGPPTTSSC